MIQKNIEVELRSVFDEKTYIRLKKFLKNNAVDLGIDDKDVHFFIFPDKLLKVVNNISQKSAKISLKTNAIGKGVGFDEYEIEIKQSEYTKAVEIFTLLGNCQIQNTFQKRHNFKYKGVEVALKYSKTWGYHIELEILVGDHSKVDTATSDIKRVAQELGVKLLSEEELQKLTQKINNDFNSGKYSSLL